MTTNSTCNICGRPFYPDHDATEPGPTVRHPFSPPVATHPVPDSGEPTDPRELLGRWVRQVWVRWASEQDDPKPSWLLGWVELDDGQREVDMRIGEALFEAGRAFAVSGRPSPAVGGANEAVLAWSRAEQRDIESARDDYRSADWRAGAVDSHIQFRNAIIAGKIAITPAVGGDQTTETRHSATIEEVREVEAERDDQELRAILAETRIRNALRGLLLGGCTHQDRFRIAIRALTDGEDEKAAIAAALNDEEQQ